MRVPECPGSAMDSAASEAIAAIAYANRKGCLQQGRHRSQPLQAAGHNYKPLGSECCSQLINPNPEQQPLSS